MRSSDSLARPSSSTTPDRAVSFVRPPLFFLRRAYARVFVRALLTPLALVCARPLPEHFFHFAVENVVGAWKILATSPDSVAKGSVTGTVFPTRFMFPRTTEWKDKNGMNS
jgi:hypothetical protein